MAGRPHMLTGMDLIMIVSGFELARKLETCFKCN